MCHLSVSFPVNTLIIIVPRGSMFQTFHPFVVPICDNQMGKCDFILHSIHFFMKLQMLRWKICQVHYNGKMLMALDDYGFCTHQTKYGLLSLNKIFKYSKTVPLGPHTVTKELLAEWQTFLTIVILYNYKCWLTEHAIWQQTDRTCYLATTLCSEHADRTYCTVKPVPGKCWPL